MRLITPPTPRYKDLQRPIREILKSKELTTGKWTKKVEERIKKIHGCKYCVLTNSATTSFMLLLKAIEKQFDFKSIHMQDFTWQSTKNMIEWMYKRKKIHYVDINKDTWLAEEPRDKNCLFIPNMTFGNVRTYKHEKTLYDSSHSIGNRECNGRGFGEIISFSPAKMITGCEGGCVITNNKKIYEIVLRLRRFHGRISELDALFLYYNLDNLRKQIRLKERIDTNYEFNLNRSFQTWNIVPKNTQYNIGIHYDFTINEIVYTHPKMNKKKRKELEKLFTIRLRYKPTDSNNKNSLWIYNHQIVLPQVIGEEQEKVIKKLNEVCP